MVKMERKEKKYKKAGKQMNIAFQANKHTET